MKKLIILATLTISAGLCQTTKIAGHALGETIDEWLTEAHIDCASKANDSRETCRTLSGLRRKDGWLDGKIDGGTPIISWLFKKGVIAMVTVVISTPFTDQQMAFLQGQYGAPVSDAGVHYQNGFGATYDLREARWNMPDGAVILANENLSTIPGGSRWLDVKVLTKEMAQALSGPAPVNPYTK